jgi:tetratricopeptide (TPR) repeat protein
LNAECQVTERRLRLHAARSLLLLVLLALLATAGYAVFPLVRGEYHVRAGRTAMERRDFTGAHDHFLRGLEDRPRSADLHFLAARAARHAGLYQSAADHLSECQRLRGPDDAISLERAMLTAQRGEVTPAVEQYLRQQIDEGTAEAVAALEALSRGYCKAHRLFSAQVYLHQWLEREPDSVDALLLRGWVAERHNRFDDAAADYHRAVALDSANQDARLRLAKVLLDGTHQTDEAAVEFERLWQAAPGQVEIGVGLAQCRARVGRSEEAAQLLDGLLDQNPDEATLLIERGKLALEMGDLAAARPWLEKAVARAPYHYQSNFALYRCLTALGDTAGAERALAQAQRIKDDLRRLDELFAALQERPSSPELRTQIGEIFLRHDEEAEGVFWLTSALEAAPEYEPARRLLAGPERPADE